MEGARKQLGHHARGVESSSRPLASRLATGGVPACGCRRHRSSRTDNVASTSLGVKEEA